MANYSTLKPHGSWRWVLGPRYCPQNTPESGRDGRIRKTLPLLKLSRDKTLWIISHTHKNKPPSADRWCWSIRGGINQIAAPQTASVTVWKAAPWGHDETSACLLMVRVKRGLQSRSDCRARRCVFVRITRWGCCWRVFEVRERRPRLEEMRVDVCARTFKGEPMGWHPIKCRSIPPLEPS